jgi:uncharacterized membrane-anchored protein
MKKTGLWLTIVVGLQVLLLLGTAVSKATNLRSANTILLETAQVDPRDLLRGDFVILNYKISSVPVEWLSPAAQQSTLNFRDVYVTLEKDGKFHTPVKASLLLVKPGPGQIVVRGTIDEPNPAFGGMIRVKYGIEKYFVREGTGNPRGALTVECAVNSDQTLQIKEVYLNGKPYAAAMREERR